MMEGAGNLWHDVYQYMQHHINMVLGWCMVAVSFAIEPLTATIHKPMISYEQMHLYNEYALLAVRAGQLVTVLIGLCFMLKDKYKNEKN